jgi:hypothetical protein
MKLPFISVALALVVPLAICTSKNMVDVANAQLPVSQSSPAPATTAASLATNWYQYTAKDGSYSVKFPGQPQEENKSVDSDAGELKYLQLLYADTTNNRAFLAMSIKYAVDSSQVQFNDQDVQGILDAARDGQAEGDESTVTSEKQISFNGLPGREITFRGKDGNAAISRIFFNPKGATLYQIIVMAGDGNLAFPESQTFLNSFAVPK